MEGPKKDAILFVGLIDVSNSLDQQEFNTVWVGFIWHGQLMRWVITIPLESTGIYP